MQLLLSSTRLLQTSAESQSTLSHFRNFHLAITANLHSIVLLNDTLNPAMFIKCYCCPTARMYGYP